VGDFEKPTGRKIVVMAKTVLELGSAMLRNSTAELNAAIEPPILTGFFCVSAD